MRLKFYITALHAALFAILLAVSPAGSGSMLLLGAGKPAAGGAAPTFTQGANVAPISNGFAAGTITFSGLNGGINYPSGAVVVVGVLEDQAATTLTSPQIGGNAASIVTGSQDSTTRCTLYQATMPSSSPDTFSFTNGGAVDRAAAVGGYFTNLASSVRDAAANETWANQADPQFLSTNPSVTATGFGFVFAAAFGATLPTAMTWTNTSSGSGDTFASLAAKAVVGSSHTAVAGAWNPTVSGVTTSMGFIACMSAATYH